MATPSDPAPTPPSDRPLPGHPFGVRLIALYIELAKQVGFRAAAFVVKLMLEFWGVDQKVPSHDAIAQWTMRLGVAARRLASLAVDRDFGIAFWAIQTTPTATQQRRIHSSVGLPSDAL